MSKFSLRLTYSTCKNAIKRGGNHCVSTTQQDGQPSGVEYRKEVMDQGHTRINALL